MKYLFILGRNIELSLAEIRSYFERTGNKILNLETNLNCALVELKQEVESRAIDNFGGVISFGEVLAEGSIAEIKAKLENIMLYMGEKNKINYLVWDYSSEDIEEYLKYRFKTERLKATLKHLAANMELQSGKKVDVSTSKNIDEEFILFEGQGKNYFGKITQKSNYEEIEKRDMEKPIIRASLSISPRLAKIMINLSEIKRREKILDAFCGVGVILQEALLQGIQAVGIDKDGLAINGARENMAWFKFDPKDYTLINNDSSNATIGDVDAMASEPDLGMVLKKVPTTNKAKETLRQFENLMINVINNLKRKIRGRIVFSSPLIRTINERKFCDIDKILERTGYKLVEGFPIDEFRGKQIVGRRIFVLEKA